ncbi:MAG: hypothetical protein Q8P67_28885, partial [archaeon]|nr:hypothetical protein [archaeon]
MTMSESSRREALSVPDLFGNVLLADSGGSVRVSASHVHSFGDGGEGFSIPENSELEERDGPEQLRTAAPPHSWSKVATHSTASLALQDLMKMKPQHVLPQTAADVEGMLGLASDDLLDPVIREKLGRLLLLWLIKGLHKSGSSTHRTETLSRNAAFALEINMTIAAFPNLLMLHFTPPPSLPEVRSESLHV